jgi:hypothetical protein
VKGLTAAAAAGKSSLAFMLSGKAASVTPAQPQPQAADQRTSITFSNKSNMVLRLAGADRSPAR